MGDRHEEIGAILKILEDKRPIRAIVYEDEGEFSVGSGGVCRIEAYGESGLHCEVAWLAVISGKEVIARVPANQVTILYKSDEGAVNG